MAKNTGVAAFALAQAGRLDEAEEASRSVLAISTYDMDAMRALATVHLARQRLQEAIDLFDTLIRLNPKDAYAHFGRGTALLDLGKPNQSLPSLEQAVTLRRDIYQYHAVRGLALLQAGDYPKGFSECRWAIHRQLPRPCKFPFWQGSSLYGKRLMLDDDEGIGDAIQYIRYAAFAKAQGAEIIVGCREQTESLLQSAPGVDKVVTRPSDIQDCDFQCPMTHLPYYFRTAVDTIPWYGPYLAASPDQQKRWEMISRAPGRRIGLVWAGNPKHKNDHRRSCSAALLAKLLDVPNTSFVNLQIGKRDGDELPGLENVIDPTRKIVDFGDTAGILTHIDLLISVDTSTLHLAGAMGRPAWLLLPYHTDWRWAVSPDRSPWYPSVRLFRQKAPDDWDTVISGVRAALLQTVSQRRMPE